MVLLPYWLALKANPIKQMPIPHGSRENFFSQGWLAVNYIIVPWGAMLLAMPFIFYKGLKETRLRPLFFGFWVTMIFGSWWNHPAATDSCWAAGRRGQCGYRRECPQSF